MLSTMTRLMKLFVFLFLLCRCDNSEPCKNERCLISDSRIIGNWKLVEECECVSIRSDSTWHEAARDVTFFFNDECGVTYAGDEGAICTEGKYSISKDTLSIVLNCNNGSSDKTIYTYEFSNDTLILKGWVDEGFIGSKYRKD